MKVAVLTCAHYDHDFHEKTLFLRKSCEKFGIELNTYGSDEKGAFNFFQDKIVELGNAITRIKNSRGDVTHILYTDAADSFFLTGLDEIIDIYKTFNAPLVCAAEKGCHPFGELADHFPPSPTPYRFINPGNFFGEIDTVLDVLSKCKAFYHLKTNDQGHWMEALYQGKINVTLDYHCNLFQCMSDREHGEVGISQANDGKAIFTNLLTNTMPCIVHFNGPKDQRNMDDMKTLFEMVVGGNS